MLEICYDASKGDLINKSRAFIIVIVNPSIYHCFWVDRDVEKERILFKGLQKISTLKGILRLDCWTKEGMKVQEKVLEFNPASLDIKEEEIGKRPPRKLYTYINLRDVERVYVKNLTDVKSKFLLTVQTRDVPSRTVMPIAKGDCLIIDRGELFISLDNRRLDEREVIK